MKTEAEIKEAVKQRYAEVATGQSCCTSDLTQLRQDCGCGGGYTEEEMASLPEGAALGLGCGNPTKILPLEPGMTVLDLGCGAGVDVFLAAGRVGPSGRVIGVDMTESMLEKARANAAAGGYTNVDFRLGEIENLPVESGTIDVIISNCVINLVPDKDRAFAEAYRVLKPGGRIQISDMVTRGQMPEAVQRNMEAWTGCISGALDREVYLEKVRRAGFSQVEVVDEFAYDAYKTEQFAALSIGVVATK
ncbi:MAG: arsenite methyltransferase [Acidobacteria bacterium]|nr:arsenite methyltransferase [Acidobacteriota bacterium]